ncbi:hypothetical protein BO70DRAFT_151964 [Aspergillus heteromorphus CBS 117.55]|uniref:Uncharacterized protein n=1 Tax=Aspergillus heteromorphus CBS 117.55 TaxID=1448321 RepID=A0A317V6I4_9EURO|nr:uncharacterized protein BO70DRAFT_151964 [Aspergillus heteromorphus CBS 117.55]PWY68658.1 hypothetical protein BO70DRAFT_151964 [Aspergillus heteromorphus CBS 117.55]
MLTVQSVCNTNSIKIPWAEVATTMGHNVSEGAIVQHLAKLRSRRVAANKAVPPPLRRGGVGAVCKSSQESAADVSESKSTRSKSLKKDTGDETSSAFPYVDSSSDEDWVAGGASKAQKKSVNRKTAGARSGKSTLKCESSDSSAESSPEGSGELLLPGATFFNYPNDERQCMTQSPESTAEPKSLTVVLKYRRSAPDANEIKNVVSDPLFATHPIEAPNNMSFPPYQQSVNTGFLPVDPSMGFMDMLTDNSNVGYLAASDASMGLPPDGCGVAPNDMWQAGPDPAYPSASYGVYPDGADMNFTDGSLDFSNDMFSHLADFEPESHQLMPHDYVPMDETMGTFDDI